VGDNQSQKAGDGALQVQVHGNVTIACGVSYVELDLRIAEARRDIAQEVLSKAQEMLREAGIQPGGIPLKTMVPLLQYASLEEDESLQVRWAAMLANASREKVGVHPLFPQLLSRLSSRDVKFLEGVFGSAVRQFEAFPVHANPANLKLARALNHTSLGQLFSELGLTPIRWALTHGDMEEFGGEQVDAQKSQLESALATLIGLGLLAMERTSAVDDGGFEVGLEVKLKHETTFRLTALGFDLVSSCHPPKKASS
jgi:hypothetical protein